MKEKINSNWSAYLAGLIDGDGSMSIRYDQEAGYQLTFSVYTTCLSLVNRLVEVFGGNFRKLPTTGNRKQKYCWYCDKPKILLNLSPFLIIKKQQGKIAESFYELGSEKNPNARRDLMNDLQSKNQKFVLIDSTFIHEHYGDGQIRKEDFCYLAGLVDAEGSFSLQKRKQSGNGSYTSYLRISNTDGSIFPWLMSRFKGRFSTTNRKEFRKEGTWSLSGEQREKIVLAILPYLIIKKERATLFLKWIRENKNMNSDEKLECFLKMKALNKRGKSPEANMSSSSAKRMKIESDPYGDVGREPAVMLSS